MPLIEFTTNHATRDCDYDLVSNLQQITSWDELNKLIDTYNCDDILDAIFAIAYEESAHEYALSENTISDWLWDYFFETRFNDVCDAFIRYKQRRNADNSSIAT